MAAEVLSPEEAIETAVKTSDAERVEISESQQPAPVRIGRWVAEHPTAIIGFGALTLYVLGIVTTLGQLRAADVDRVGALGVIPLERHLRNGVAIITNPDLYLLLGAFVLVWFSLRGPSVFGDTSRAKHGHKTKAEQAPKATGATEAADTTPSAGRERRPFFG